MKREPPLKPGDLFQNQFEIRRLIGAGGHAFVYEAYDQFMEREVALKLIEIPEVSPRDRRRRARTEAQVMAAITHPNVVRVHGSGVADERWIYLVMELLKGRSLRQVLLELGTLTLAEALLIVRQIAEGVHAAHLQGVIHRDLKPDNVFIERGNHVRVFDFGVAKKQGPDSPTTERDLVQGTGVYMSPEHIECTGVTTASDVFALGVIYYEILFGCCPALVSYMRTGLGLIECQISIAPPTLAELLPNFPSYASRFAERMLAKSPAERIADMAEVASLARNYSARLAREGAAELIEVRDLSITSAVRPGRPRAAVLVQQMLRPNAEGTTSPALQGSPLPFAAFPSDGRPRDAALALAASNALTVPLSQLMGTTPIQGPLARPARDRLDSVGPAGLRVQRLPIPIASVVHEPEPPLDSSLATSPPVGSTTSFERERDSSSAIQRENARESEHSLRAVELATARPRDLPIRAVVRSRSSKLTATSQHRYFKWTVASGVGFGALLGTAIGLGALKWRPHAQTPSVSLSAAWIVPAASIPAFDRVPSFEPAKASADDAQIAMPQATPMGMPSSGASAVTTPAQPVVAASAAPLVARPGIAPRPRTVTAAATHGTIPPSAAKLSPKARTAAPASSLSRPTDHATKEPKDRTSGAASNPLRKRWIRMLDDNELGLPSSGLDEPAPVPKGSAAPRSKEAAPMPSKPFGLKLLFPPEGDR
ncbi:MAG: protein kinase domain-containing protein [Myxococcota bacterium]